MLSFFTCLLGFFSCSSSDGEPEVSSPVVSVAPTQITATYEGSVTTLSVKSDQEWTAFIFYFFFSSRGFPGTGTVNPLISILPKFRSFGV